MPLEHIPDDTHLLQRPTRAAGEDDEDDDEVCGDYSFVLCSFQFIRNFLGILFHYNFLTVYQIQKQFVITKFDKYCQTN